MFQQIGLKVGQNHGLVDLLHGQLRFGIKGAEAFGAIAVKFKAVRPVRCVTKDVQNSSPDGVLTGFVHKIHPLKAHFAHQFDQKIQINGFVFIDFYCVTSKGCVNHHLFHQGLGPGHQPMRSFVVAKAHLTQNPGPLQNQVRILFAIPKFSLVRTWKQGNMGTP